MDQFHTSLPRVAFTVCDLMDCADPTRVLPCSVYAALFVCIDIVYNVFEYQVLAHADATQISARIRRLARRRSLVVLASFGVAMLLAFVNPLLGFGLIWAALILHLRPDVRTS
jgi:uncharacterized membrane protein